MEFVKPYLLLTENYFYNSVFLYFCCFFFLCVWERSTGMLLSWWATKCLIVNFCPRLILFVRWGVDKVKSSFGNFHFVFLWFLHTRWWGPKEIKSCISNHQVVHGIDFSRGPEYADISWYHDTNILERNMHRDFKTTKVTNRLKNCFLYFPIYCPESKNPLNGNAACKHSQDFRISSSVFFLHYPRDHSFD